MDLLTLPADYFSRYVLAAVRVLGAIGLNPLLGSPRVPLQARLGLGLFATLIILPPGGPGPAVSIAPTSIAGELLLGLLVGFTVTLVFGAVQFAASLINFNIGMGIIPSVDPGLDLGGGGLERFLYLLALLIFVQIDGHHQFIAALHHLFELVPVGTVGLQPATAEQLTVLSAALFTSALRMALPALAALLLADLGLAILARVAPQFNLFALGLPLKAVVGLSVTAVAVPLIVPRLAAMFRAVPASMFGLVG